MRYVAVLLALFLYTDVAVGQSGRWKQLTRPVKDDTLIIDALAGGDNGLIYAAVNPQHGVYVSEDGGETWAGGDSLGPGFVIEDMTIDEKGDVYFGVGLVLDDGEGGLYRSSDQGVSWERVGFPDQDVNAILDAGASQLFIGAESGIYRSSDTGWEQVATSESETTALTTSPDGDIFAGIQASGEAAYAIYRSGNNGINWEGTGLSGVNVEDLEADQDGNIFAGTNHPFWTGRERDLGVSRSQDGGFNWELMTATEVGRYSAYEVEIDASGTIWTRFDEVGIFKSEDKGKSWIEVNEGLNIYEDTGEYRPVSFTVSKDGLPLVAMQSGNIYKWQPEGTSVEDPPRPNLSPISLSAPAPNPASLTFEMTLSVKKPQVVRMSIFDAMGRRVKRISSDRILDEKVLKIDVGDLPSGVYIIRAAGSSATFSRSLIVTQ